MADCILRAQPVRGAAVRLRRRFLEMRYCFSGGEAAELFQTLHALI
jgi:hypothetical protein